MQCRFWIYATRTHNREQSCQLLSNLFLCPTEPLTEASGTKTSLFSQVKKKNHFCLHLVTFHLSCLLFPSLQPLHKLAFVVTRTNQAVTFQKSLEIHFLGNPIAPTADLLDRKLMYLTLPEEVRNREGNGSLQATTSWPAFHFWS